MYPPRTLLRIERRPPGNFERILTYCNSYSVSTLRIRHSAKSGHGLGGLDFDDDPEGTEVKKVVAAKDEGDETEIVQLPKFFEYQDT